MEAQNIILCLLTSLLCQASNSTVSKDISHAVGYMILANLANLFQLTLRDPEPIRSLKKDHCKNITLLYLLLCVTIGFSWGSAAFTLNESALVSLGLYFIGLRSSLAVCHSGMQSSSLGNSFNEYLILLTGLRLCQEIKREESKKADGDVNGDNLRKDSVVAAEPLKEAHDNQTELEGWEVIKKTEFQKKDED